MDQLQHQILTQAAWRLGRPNRSRIRSRAALFAALLAVAGALVPTARADDPLVIEVLIKDHRFAPAEIRVPAGHPAVLHLDNQDPTAEEFDSVALGIEKVIAGGRKSIVRLPALKAGHYPFMGEYHADTAQGVVIAE